MNAPASSMPPAQPKSKPRGRIKVVPASRRAALSFLVCTSLLVSAAPAQALTPAAADHMSPSASEALVTPRSADMEQGLVDITVRVRLADATGVKPPTVVMDSARTSGDIPAFEGELQLISGTARDGVWGTQIKHPGTGPESWISNEWSLWLPHLEDTIGNTSEGTVYLGTTEITDSRPYIPLSKPVIIGEQHVGSALSVDLEPEPGEPPLPTDVEVAYRWRNWEGYIPGATGPTLTLTPELMDEYISVHVMVRAPGRAGNVASSESIPPASHPRINGTRPVIKGSPVVGSQLQAVLGTWQPADSVELHTMWLADGQPIDWAHGTTLKVDPSLRGRVISIRVTGASRRHWTPMRTIASFSEPTPPIRVIPENQVKTFTDAPRGSTFYEAVQWLTGAGITTGYADGRFGVRDHVTRGQTAAFLYRFTPNPFYPKWAAFRDVPREHTFYEAVFWAAANEITTGYGDGSFRPSSNVTRGELATFLYRLSEEEHSTSADQIFSDVRPASGHSQGISWLKSSGLTTGYADGTFKPQKPITRGEAAALLHRYEQSVRLR